MSLVIRVSVNETPLYWVTARRMEKTAEATEPDTINTYEVRRVWNDPEKPDSDFRQIMHRYGDGATVLARKMLKGLHDAQ